MRDYLATKMELRVVVVVSMIMQVHLSSVSMSALKRRGPLLVEVEVSVEVHLSLVSKSAVSRRGSVVVEVEVRLCSASRSVEKQ